VGTYWNSNRVFKAVVTLKKGRLFWALQGLKSEKYELMHYERDTFTWLLPRNELSKRGRWVGIDQGAEFWKVNFKPGVDGQVKKLRWAHDIGVVPIELTREIRESSCCVC